MQALLFLLASAWRQPRLRAAGAEDVRISVDHKLSASCVCEARARTEGMRVNLLAAQFARQLQLREQRRQSRDMDEAALRAHRGAACGLLGAS